MNTHKVANFLFGLFFSVVFNTFIFADNFLVTCATSGLGQAISESLAKEGHSLLLSGRNHEKLNEIKDKLEKHYDVKVQTISLDFETNDSIQQTIDEIKLKYHDFKIKGMVLIGPRPQLPKTIPQNEDWEKNFQQTFIGPLNFLKQTLFLFDKKSSLVILSGVTSKYFIPNYPNTNVIRLMWTGEAKNLVHQLAPLEIRVNSVSPGVILTEFNERQLESRAKMSKIETDEQLKKETDSHPLKRYGKPEDVANVVKYLLSPNSAYLNGENIAIDGGVNPSY